MYLASTVNIFERHGYIGSGSGYKKDSPPKTVTLMLRKFTWLLLLVTGSILFFSFKEKFYSSQPPPDHTGTPSGNGTCANCHGNLNNGGGSVVVNGLPSSFQAGQTYSFSVTITHPSVRQRWGFAISALNANEQPVGSFASTNPKAALNGSPTELTHNDAVFSTGTSYTYSNLTWTAPASINAGDNAVTFYVVGNAANGNFSSSGDFIYFATRQFALPITLKQFNFKVIDGDKVQLTWSTSSENNSKEFIVEKSDDNNHFQETGRLAAAGQSSVEKSYRFVDDKPSFFNRPIYYRLKLVDNDGKFKYSKVLQLTLKGRQSYLYSIQPKLDRSKVDVGVYSEKAAAAEATILGANGVVVTRTKFQLNAGRNLYQIPTMGISAGVYYLKFRSENVQQSIAFYIH